MIVDKLKKNSEKPWFYPLALLVIGFVSYGYVLTSLGYFWADWEIMMFAKLNPSLQFGYYAVDRPFPWTYRLINFLVGSHPIGWHIVTLLIRWAGTLFFVNSIILLWPQYKNHFFWLGALLIVYPGFLQQSQSATKARHIMALLLFALSVYLMVLAVKRPKWSRLLFPLSWIATFSHLFTIEYFSGIELMRPLLLWILVVGSNKPNLHMVRRVVVYSLPYLLITAFFFWCRFVYFPEIFQTMHRLGDISSTVGRLQGSFIEFLLNLFSRAFLDLVYSTLQVWVSAIFNMNGFTFQRITAWFAFGLGVMLTIAFSFFYGFSEEETPENSSPTSVFLVGFFLYVFSALPIWAINKEVSTGGWNDRFALAPMLGAGLMVIALLLWIVRPARQKIVLNVLLVFSIATQVWVVNLYRRDWNTQLDYYWQLQWRVPALQSDTAIFSFEFPSPFIGHDTEASYAINVLFNYETDDGSLPYLFLTPEEPSYFQPMVEFKKQIRNLEFNGNTSNSVVVVHQTGDACLRVLDTVYKHDPLFHEGHERLIPISNTSRIIPDPAAVLDTDIYGPEPGHTWCYFFEKADLARQTEDWKGVLELFEQAQQQGFTPNYGAEYIPFIEAYAYLGDWQKAYDFTLKADQLTPNHKRMLCSIWDRFGEIPSADMKIIERIDQYLSC